MIDTGAARGRKGGKNQYLGYCRDTRSETNIDRVRGAVGYFGIGSFKLIAVTNGILPLGSL